MMPLLPSPVKVCQASEAPMSVSSSLCMPQRAEKFASLGKSCPPQHASITPPSAGQHTPLSPQAAQSTAANLQGHVCPQVGLPVQRPHACPDCQHPRARFMLENNPLFIISLSEPNVLIG